jgi:hypothetical protein
MKRNIPSHFVTGCNDCSKTFHRCCRDADLSCPSCVPYEPTITSGQSHLNQEQTLINKEIDELGKTINQKEIEFRQTAHKLDSGILTKKLENVLEKYGGSRKAFFQAYSGGHLIKMGNNLPKIIEELPPEITSDKRIEVIFEAIKLFFEAKKTMKKEFMSDVEIETMKGKILEFGNYMKNNLGHMKTKQKGHLFLFEAPKFSSKFKTSSIFTDETIESYHPLMNDQESRIKCKESPKKFLLFMKWGIDHNYYYDNVDCVDHKDN